MGKNSEIAWTEHTFNPWWGCTKISEGCAHCYAETWAKRTGFKIWGDNADRRYFGDKHWSEPVKWDSAAAKLGVMHRVFCGSMCDIMENQHSLPQSDHVREARDRVFRQLVPTTPNLLWLFLTKRPESAASLLPPEWRGSGNWPRNVMLGVTIENDRRLLERMPHVVELHRLFPGILTFASCEPLLSALNWTSPRWRGTGCNENDWLEYLDWVIGGGESGNGARPMDQLWIRKLRDDCQDRDDMGRPWPLPFLFKQYGGMRPGGDRLLDGRTWDGVPHLPYGPQLPGVENYGACEVRR